MFPRIYTSTDFTPFYAVPTETYNKGVTVLGFHSSFLKMVLEMFYFN